MLDQIEVNLNPTTYCTAMWDGYRCNAKHEFAGGYEYHVSNRDGGSRHWGVHESNWIVTHGPPIGYLQDALAEARVAQ